MAQRPKTPTMMIKINRKCKQGGSQGISLEKNAWTGVQGYSQGERLSPLTGIPLENAWLDP